MRKLSIEMKMNNDAFVEAPGKEAARILRDLADKVERSLSSPSMYRGLSALTAKDYNGNTVAFLFLE